MTIEEARELIEIFISDPTALTQKEYFEAKGVVNGYEAKEKELEKCIVVPEGWYLAEFGFIDDSELIAPFYVSLGNKSKRVKGFGSTENEALKNAIKQINNRL